MKDDNNFSVSVTGKDLLKMIKELKPLLWFLAFVLLLYVVSLVVGVIAPDGLVKP